MLDAFPGSLVSMTRIIHYCRKAAVPLYLVDGILKIILEEVSANRLNLLDPPSSQSTMKDLKQLFVVPIPCMVAIPLERTLLLEQANAFYPHSPTFPTFSFLEQLQDLLSNEYSTCLIINEVSDDRTPHRFCIMHGRRIIIANKSAIYLLIPCLSILGCKLFPYLLYSRPCSNPCPLNHP
jgi:hypothetical protein